ncbi:putative MFS family arabinose efflux permease [Arthrobacter ulcerisalmonis]|uniref:MFS transporter n=1 Tax=Arthrobacter sp. B1I2 TaxID=3042263 RepID=UPI002784C07E|nr:MULTISPECIES: MFS transporter [Arthrobacter]MDQ0664496.1 putative MFS family arabinose efflux permease [Arthrobacter ulcerisalmonis]MDQ0732412.1 putative MFS family arabinose efflux permease [Arthrobacter sp. B1I2]
MRALVVSGMALIAATYGLARFGYGLFLPRFTETFHMDSATAGLIQAGSFLSFCFAAFLASRIAARPTLVVLCAGATAALGSVGVAVAPNVVVLAISVVLAGAGAGFATPGLVTLIERDIVPPLQESAQTIVNAGTGAGIVVAGILMLLTIGQWRLGWLAIAVLVSIAAVATLRADRSAHRGRAADPPPRVRARDLTLLAWPIVAAALAGASSAAIWTFGRTVMDASRPGEESYSIVAWIVLGASGVLGATAGKIVKVWSLRTAWILTSLAMAGATTVLGAAPSAPFAAYTSMALFAASYTALCGVLIIWAVRLVPNRAAEGTAALFIALAIGQAVGSATLGVLFTPDSPGLAFTVAGILGILAVLPAMKSRPDASSCTSTTAPAEVRLKRTGI